MKEILTKTGIEYKWSCDDNFALIQIDDGKPYFVKYVLGDTAGLCSVNTAQFDDKVEEVLSILLQKDLELFKRVRNALTGRYYAIADYIRQEAKKKAEAEVEKYNF